MIALVVLAIVASASATSHTYESIQYPSIYKFDKNSQFKRFDYGPAYKTHTFQGFNPAYNNEFVYNKDFVQPIDAGKQVVYVVPEHQKNQFNAFEYGKPVYQVGYEQAYSQPFYGRNAYDAPAYSQQVYSQNAYNQQPFYKEQIYNSPAFQGQQFQTVEFAKSPAFQSKYVYSGAAPQSYGAAQQGYGAAQQNYGAAQQSYGASQQSFGIVPQFGGEYATGHPYAVNKVFEAVPAYAVDQAYGINKPVYHFQTVVESPTGVKKVVDTQVVKEGFNAYNAQKAFSPFARFDSDIRKPLVQPGFVKSIDTFSTINKNVKV